MASLIRKNSITVLTTLAAISLLAACSSSNKKQKFAYVERPVENLYQGATEALERKRYDRAVPLFEEVERQHPFSPWARRAGLMKAYAHYSQNNYEDAITALDQFIALHPGNKDTPYAYYLRAMSFYERIRDVGRDQEYTNNAVQAMNDVVRRFPQTEYARDARLKLDLTFDHLAGKEMYVGRYYLKAGKHIAAINRFKYVVDNYQTTSHVPEALHRMTEAYLQVGVAEEARQVASVLGFNYPGSEWYEYSYNLLSKYNLLEDGSTPPPNKRALKRKRKLEKKNKKKPTLKDLEIPADLSGTARAPESEPDIDANSRPPTDNPFPGN